MAEIHDLKIVAEFSNEMLEQIRAIVREEVREEVRAALNENESERMMEEDASLVSGTIAKDGTPYSAGHDEQKTKKRLGQIAYEAFTLHSDYRKLVQCIGGPLQAPTWDTLSFVEQEIWTDVARVVLEAKEQSQ